MMSNPVCDTFCVDKARVNRARARQRPARTVLELAETFRLLGDPTRLRLLEALYVEELCVCDLAALVGMSSSAVSHQLRLLRAAGLVRYRKSGKMVYYTLDDTHVRDLFETGFLHVAERAPPAVAAGKLEGKMA
jgi:DNA-binding transcriptional ArsR family regulator